MNKLIEFEATLIKNYDGAKVPHLPTLYNTKKLVFFQLSEKNPIKNSLPMSASTVHKTGKIKQAIYFGERTLLPVLIFGLLFVESN